MDDLENRVTQLEKEQKAAYIGYLIVCLVLGALIYKVFILG